MPLPIPSRGLVASRLRLPLGILAAAVVYGIAGYILLEGWGFFDALYMTVITLATVGFQEVLPLSTAGRMFTISLILVGLVALVAAVGAVADLIVSGDLGISHRRRRMSRVLSNLTDHYIICAYGRVGRAAGAEFRKLGVPFVAIDVKEDVIVLLESEGVPFIQGDPSDESTLREAGIERARGLVCAVDSDAVNVFIALTARALNPNLAIVARASEAGSVEKLQRAGADRVISPYDLSGRRMAFQALRPSVVEFVDMVTVAPDLRLEEVEITPDSHLAGRTVRQACAAHPGVSIVAVKQGGELVPSPRQDTVLAAGDLVIALGPVAGLSDMAV